MSRDSPTGLWHANEQMERSALLMLQSELAAFDQPIANAYEAGVQAPTLSARRHSEPDMRAAALFLKRTLVDLRGTWVLISRGYSSPAAAVAASLWEHALAATVLAGSQERHKELRDTPAGDLPWSPKRLAGFGAAALEDTVPAHIVRTRSRNMYAAYKWLCKSKHPTLRATLHDAGAATTNEGTFVVMSAPDLRPENLPVKRLILLISCGRTIEAIKRFTKALGCDEGTQAYQDFSRRLTEADAGLLNIAREDREAVPFGLTPAEGLEL